MTGVFGAFADRQGVYFPGAPFILAAIAAAMAAMILALTCRRHA
jgi:DHA1 family tetracycline resistance protein-like MFS transporter